MTLNGWRHDPKKVASAKGISAFAEQKTADAGAFNALIRQLPGVHWVAGRASWKIISKHLNNFDLCTNGFEEMLLYAREEFLVFKR